MVSYTELVYSAWELFHGGFWYKLILFKHCDHAVVLKTHLCVFGVTGQPECVAWLYPHWTMIGGTCKLMILYHGVLGKETFSCA